VALLRQKHVGHFIETKVHSQQTPTQGKASYVHTEHMHVNQSLIGQAVFEVVNFHLDASVKMSSPLPNCHINDTT